MPDEELAGHLLGDASQVVMSTLYRHLPNAGWYVEKRFGREFMNQIIAASLDKAGYDGEAFLALPPDEQDKFLAREGYARETCH